MAKQTIKKINTSWFLGVSTQIEELIEFYCENITDDELEQAEDFLDININDEALSIASKYANILLADFIGDLININLIYNKETGVVNSDYEAVNDTVDSNLNENFITESHILQNLLLTAQHVIEMRDDDLTYKQRFQLLEHFTNGRLNE